MTFTKYPELLKDKAGKVYLAPNCYCMVDLSTGKTVNRPQYGLTSLPNWHGVRLYNDVRGGRVICRYPDGEE